MPELAEAARVLGDLLRRVVGVADEDLLGGEDDLGGRPEPVDVKPTILVEKVSRLRLARLQAELSM